MDGNTPRAEAERWLGIAVKLLTARDFLGSKTFAIRAKESDPTNEVSDQILAVVDTVLAGEKRVNSAHHPDWYTVLQLPRLVRDPDLISGHYRRLLTLLNPERNRIPFADYALQLVMDAWSILSDPNRKWMFDTELSVYLQQQQQQQPPPQQPPVRVEAVRVESSSANQQLNTFQFFQQPPPQAPPQTAAMWSELQQQNNQNFLQHHHQQQQQQQQQQHPIEFMQGPPVAAAVVGQLPPQWQMRDPTPAKGGGGGGGGGGERSKGVMNGMGMGMTSLVGTSSSGMMMNSTTQPMMRRVDDVAPPPQAVVRESVRVSDGNVGNNVNVSNVNFNSNVNVISSNNNNNNNNNNVVVDDSRNVRSNVGVMHVNVDDDDVVVNNNNVSANVNDDVVVEDADDVVHNDENDDGGGGGGVEEERETFWTSCPYCFYVFEYQKVYHECTLRCQNCRRGFQAVQIPTPPPISSGGHGGAGGGKKDEKGSFCCWGFFPLGFSTVAWRKQNQTGKSGNWVPFSPMFACPVENGGGDFQWFESNGGAAVGPKYMGRPPLSQPSVEIIDEDGDFNSDPSDSDSSDKDWRRNPAVEKKKKIKKRGRVWKGGHGRPKIAKPQIVTVQVQANHAADVGERVSVGGEALEDGSNPQDAVGSTVVKEDARKKVATTTLTRNQARRRMKNMGKLDLNVEFNNEGDEHAPAANAVNVGEDGVENIEFFEGLDEFLSTLPILNVTGDEKAKPS